MDLSSLRSAIDHHRRPSGRLIIDPLLRAKILEAYATWREGNGSQKAFVESKRSGPDLFRKSVKFGTFTTWQSSAESTRMESLIAQELASLHHIGLASFRGWPIGYENQPASKPPALSTSIPPRCVSVQTEKVD